MAHKHKYTTRAGTAGQVTHCSCGKTRTATVERFTSSRARQAARTAARKG